MDTKQPTPGFIERIAIGATTWIGSVPSLIFHTIIFILFFTFIVLGFDSGKVMLILTTIVSLEAIYLSIFIQMSVNRQAQSLAEVEEDIDDISEDIDEIQEDIDDISEDIDDISEDIDDISEDIDDLSDEEKEEETQGKNTQVALDKIQLHLQQLIAEVDRLKNSAK